MVGCVAWLVLPMVSDLVPLFLTLVLGLLSLFLLVLLVLFFPLRFFVGSFSLVFCLLWIVGGLGPLE